MNASSSTLSRLQYFDSSKNKQCDLIGLLRIDKVGEVDDIHRLWAARDYSVDMACLPIAAAQEQRDYYQKKRDQGIALES